MSNQIINYIKELQREYKPGSDAYNVLRKLELELPPMIERQVKNCDLGDVSGSSLPLKIERVVVVAAQRWGKDYAGSTVGIIGREAVEICEKHGIDWVNYR